MLKGFQRLSKLSVFLHKSKFIFLVKTKNYGHQLFTVNNWFDPENLRMSAVENVRYQIIIYTGRSSPKFQYGQNVQIQISGGSNRTNWWNLGYSDTHQNDNKRFNK